MFPKVVLQRRRAAVGLPGRVRRSAPLRSVGMKYGLNVDDAQELLKGKHLQERQRRPP